MSDEELRAAAQAWWDHFNSHDLSRIDDQVAPDFTNANALPGTPDGPEGVRQVHSRLWAAFPDMRFEVEEIFVAPNRVAVLGWMSGTQEGQFGPFAPSGNSHRTRQVHTLRFDEDGLVSDHTARTRRRVDAAAAWPHARAAGQLTQTGSSGPLCAE